MPDHQELAGWAFYQIFLLWPWAFLTCGFEWKLQTHSRAAWLRFQETHVRARLQVDCVLQIFVWRLSELNMLITAVFMCVDPPLHGQNWKPPFSTQNTD